MNIYHLYCITNIINGKKYIGQTTLKNPYNRWKQHLKLSNKSTKSPRRAIHDAILKYGKENFKFELIACCKTLDDLNETEILLIKQHKSLVSENGYNLTAGGNNCKLSKETKLKISKKLSKNFSNVWEEKCQYCKNSFYKSYKKGNEKRKTCSKSCETALRTNTLKLVCGSGGRKISIENEQIRREKIKNTLKNVRYKNTLSKKLSKKYRRNFNKNSKVISNALKNKKYRNGYKIIYIIKDSVIKQITANNLPQYRKYGWSLFDNNGASYPT